VSGGEKTEAPTPKKLRDAAREGDVLQSRELSTALVFGIGVAWVMLAGALLVRSLEAMMRSMLVLGAADISAFAPGKAMGEAIAPLAGPLSMLLALTVGASLAAPAMLGSLALRLQSARPKWSRIDPAAGLKRMFGTAGLGELGKSVAKVVLVGGICVGALLSERWVLLGLAASDATSASARVGVLVVTALAAGAAAFVLVALVDVPWQAMQRRKRLAMSIDEVRREARESDGAPELKRERRSRQYAMATSSARAAMKEATVVLTNPTHFAVALRYRPETDAVPIVVARGVDEAAAAIRDLAKGNNVPCLDYPALTRAIYFTSKTGEGVREDLYLAVATVLAFVMQLDAAIAAGRGRPEVDLPESMRFGADGRREA